MGRALVIGRMRNNRYRILFDTFDGKIVCDVSVSKQSGRPDTRTHDQKRVAAVEKATALAKKFSTALAEEN